MRQTDQNYDEPAGHFDLHRWYRSTCQDTDPGNRCSSQADRLQQLSADALFGMLLRMAVDRSSPPPPLHEQISAHIVRLIEGGALGPGARVPSVRKLAGRFGVSTNTVLRAFGALEARGLVEVRPQSGHYVRGPAPSLPGLAPLALAASVVRPDDRVTGFVLGMRRCRVTALGLAALAPELLPADRLARLAAQVARRAGAKALSYDPLPGHAPLRRQVARRLVDAGCAIEADDLVITFGAVEALHLSLRAVTRPGDAVLVESPCYFGVLQLLAELGLRALEVPADPELGLRVDLVERALARERMAACVVVPTCSNPLGGTMPVPARRALVELCGARRVPIIESGVYGDLHLGREPLAPLKAFDASGGVIHCSSFSKTLVPGYRVGWVAAGRFRDRVEELKHAQTMATPLLTQATIAEFLLDGGYDSHLRRLRRTLGEQVARTRETVARHFPPGTRISRPEGGFLLWVELPPGSVDALELQRRALRHGISIAPGPIFSASDRFRHCLRVSAGHPLTPALEEAVAVLGRLATR